MRLALIFLMLTLGSAAQAARVPAVRGKIDNQTNYPLSQLKVMTRWYCIPHRFFPSPKCRGKRKDVESAVKADGSFATPAFTPPPVPAGSETAVLVFVLDPERNLHTLASSQETDLFRAPLDGVFYQINEARIRLQLANGGDYLEWIKNEAPGRELDATLGLKFTGKELDGQAPEDFYHLKEDSFLIPPFFGAFLRRPDPQMSFTLKLGILSVELASVEYQGPLRRDALSDLGAVAIDSARINTEVSGNWRGIFLTDGLAPHLDFPLENLEVEFRADCRDGRLNGELVTYKPEERGKAPVQELSVSGECRNGFFSFEADMIFFRYRRDQKVTLPLKVMSNFISNSEARADLAVKGVKTTRGAARLER